MDPITLGAGALVRAADSTAQEAGKLSANLLGRLLGPSADVIGEDWAQRLRQRNLARLLAKADKRTDGSPEPGYTTPRVAAAAFESAQYADDEIVSEYLSGVLASSRAPDGGTDAGVPWASLISRLSSDQLRLHFLVYSSARSPLIADVLTSTATIRGDEVNSIHGQDILLPLDELVDRMQLGAQVNTRFSDAIDGLMREDLISSSYSYGELAHVESSSVKHGGRLDAPFDRGLRVGVTIHGIRLFIWGLGRGGSNVNEYLSPGADMGLADPEPGLEPLKNTVLYARSWRDAIEGELPAGIIPPQP